MRQFSGFLMWPILIVALSAFIDRGACAFCPTVEKDKAIYLHAAMTKVTTTDLGANCGSPVTKCVECYTKTESNHIEYIAGCGNAVSDFVSTTDLTKYTCTDTTGCSAATGHTCHPVLALLVAATGAGKPPVETCLHATLGGATPVTGNTDVKVVCHGAAPKCAYGVGYGDDKTTKLGYMGCKAACEAAMKGKTTADGKNYVKCTECGSSTPCENLNAKTPTAGDVIPQTTAKSGSASSPDGSSKATTTRGNGATTCTKASVMAIFATSAVVLRVFGLSL